MLEDQDTSIQILDSLQHAQQAVIECSNALLGGNKALFDSIAKDLAELLLLTMKMGYGIEERDEIFTIGKCADSCLYSLMRIIGYEDIEKKLHKIEFELLPLLQEAYLFMYYHGCVSPDPERMERFFNEEFESLCSNRYLENAAATDSYKYELSIYVLGYNKLDYTKLCVESVLKTVPKNLDYELILVNHGSTDETRQYFESVKPTKQLDIKVNGGGVNAISRIVEGRYVLAVSNDTMLTECAIENMLRCIKSDPQIGYLVPTTPNVSNYQTIPVSYGSLDGLHEFAKNNNQYDEFRHEQRVRLCNPITMLPSALWYCKGGLGTRKMNLLLSYSRAFPDDAVSLIIRRNNYKNVLAKDAFCHHFGSVTIKEEIQSMDEAAVYTESRKNFHKTFGIDPWGTGNCYSRKLTKLFECGSFPHVDILGINCGLGSNSLKLKELYKEEKRNTNVTLYNVTDNRSYEQDLNGVSDSVRIIEDAAELFLSGPKHYHHIVYEDMLRLGSDHVRFLMNCFSRLHGGGSLLFRPSANNMERLARIFKNMRVEGDWAIVTK